MLSWTTRHPPCTLSTSLGRASPLHWSTTSSSEGGRGLGGVLNGGSSPPYIALSRVHLQVNFQGGTIKNVQGVSWRKMGLIGPSRGSAEPLLAPFGPIFGRCIPCGLLMGIAGCTGWSWVVLACYLSPNPCITQDVIFFMFLLCSLRIFFIFWTCVPAINDSPILVELVSDNSYHYWWYSIFKCLWRSWRHLFCT